MRTSRVQDNADRHSDYIEHLKKAQEGYSIWPVVWNQGRCTSVPPLSPLHLRIGLQDVPDNENLDVPAAGEHTQEAPPKVAPQMATTTA